jgi:hypothetical protein
MKDMRLQMDYMLLPQIGLEQYLPDTAGIQFWGSSFMLDHRRDFGTSLTTKKKSLMPKLI